MKSDTHNNLICMRIDNATDVIEGSLQSNCQLCDAPIWMAPSSKTLLIERDMTVICHICAAKKVTKEDKFTPLTEEQIQEIIDHENDSNTNPG